MNTFTLAQTEHGQFIILHNSRVYLQAVRTREEAEGFMVRIIRGQGGGERHDHADGCKVRYKCGDIEFEGVALYSVVI